MVGQMVVFFGAVVLIFGVVCGADEDLGLFPKLPVGIIQTTNGLCREHSRLYLEHLRNLSIWAHEMKDSSAPGTIGLLRGSFSQFGQFEECLTSKSPFPTQYCLATIVADVPKPDPPRNPKSLEYEANESVLRKIYDHKDASQQPENVAMYGWCVPSSCSPSDLQNYLNLYLNSMDFHLKKFNVSYVASVDERGCQREDENQYFDYLDISFCLTVGIVTVLIVVSTCMSLFVKEAKPSEKSPIHQLVSAFSIADNLQALSKTDNSSNPALKTLYGVRVFSICMIIMDHRFGTHLSSGVLNFNLVEEQYRSAWGSLFFHGDLFVDSFFILSGLLVTYCLLVQYDKKFVNPAFIILMRYIRLTPIYAFVVFYYATLFNYIGYGPMWKTIIAPEVQDCRANWWTNLLYISNYVNADHMCMVHSWYLPCDFHYFIVALFICLAIHKNKKLGLMLLGFVTFMSVFVPFLIGLIYERPGVLFFYPEFLRAPKQHIDFLISYSKSHTRASPYFIGMVIGYLYYKMKNNSRHLSRVWSHLITLTSVAIMITSILTGMVFYDPDYKYNAFESSLYAAMHRTIWAIGSVGVLYVASYGYGSIAYKFLAWKPWVPLSKLVYGAYLVHMQFQMRAVARKGGADVVTYFDIISFSLSDIVLAFATAFILHLAIEAPVRNIFKILLAPPPQAQKTKNKSDENVSDNTCDSHL